MISPKLIKQSLSQQSNYFLLVSNNCHIAICEIYLSGGKRTHTQTHIHMCTHTFIFSILGTSVIDVMFKKKINFSEQSNILLVVFQVAVLLKKDNLERENEKERREKKKGKKGGGRKEGRKKGRETECKRERKNILITHTHTQSP